MFSFWGHGTCYLLSSWQHVRDRTKLEYRKRPRAEESRARNRFFLTSSASPRNKPSKLQGSREMLLLGNRTWRCPSAVADYDFVLNWKELRTAFSFPDSHSVNRSIRTRFYNGKRGHFSQMTTCIYFFALMESLSVVSPPFLLFGDSWRVFNPFPNNNNNSNNNNNNNNTNFSVVRHPTVWIEALYNKTQCDNCTLSIKAEFYIKFNLKIKSLGLAGMTCGCAG